MAKFKIGTVELGTSAILDGEFVIASGNLVKSKFPDMGPVHRVHSIELPDGAIPFAHIVAEDGDVLAWYMLVE